MVGYLTYQQSICRTIWNDVMSNKTRAFTLRHNKQCQLGQSEDWIFFLLLVTHTCNVLHNVVSCICWSIGHHFKRTFDTFICTWHWQDAQVNDVEKICCYIILNLWKNISQMADIFVYTHFNTNHTNLWSYWTSDILYLYQRKNIITMQIMSSCIILSKYITLLTLLIITR